MDATKNTLKKLGLSDAEIRVYDALLAHGSLSAAELTKATRGKRPTVYYAIRQLLERGLIHKLGAVGIERFQAEAPEKLLQVLALRQQELTALENEVKAIIPSLTPERAAHEGKPTVLFYEGEEAMKRVIMETLYCRSGHIDSIAPADNFFWQAGEAFGGSYVAERARRKITTRNLWEKPLEPAIMLKSYKGLSQVRILPPEMRGQFRTTVFLFDESVMYISSRGSGYVLVVRSKEHHELMKAMYESLWAGAEETHG